MGYESLSTVVVLVIVAIIIVVWLPVRTANGMKRATEHRQDRYSPSLHIVEAESGTRFGDVKPHQAKGAPVPASSPSARLTPEHIAHVRELRRAAIRRRQLLAGGLAAVAVVVFVLALVFHFSTLFTLIPLALLAAVLAMGARAASQARRWEAKVSRVERERARKSKAAKIAHERAIATARAQAKAVAGGRDERDGAAGTDAAARREAATEVMEQRQIRRALRQAEIEQARAKALREARAEGQETVRSNQESATAAEVRGDVSDAAQVDAGVAGSAERAGDGVGQATAAESSLTMRDERDERDGRRGEVPDDATSELASVRPARALDVFDMATASQDLISFSLGAARNESNTPEPESREIQSAKQVSKAEPVGPETAERLLNEAKVVKAADDAKAASEAQAAQEAEDARAREAQEAAKQAAFHESEQHAEVAAPDATSESLSVGLDSIMARRGN
ncbi:magnesium transporter [Bifidobacterium myosotis]|uniref:Magnesium transporter n=1 Tax=Bifidobacterium myosotis TaxID=1630166 RepID=A0A5M9ZPW8_9BIFI|nr:magnesium transporter [Bifidobacterium myosotis]KAA8828892.1 magnesium transporter [Bifidobacterium myosotis]